MGRTFLKIAIALSGVGLATYVGYRIWKDKKNTEIDNTVLDIDDAKRRLAEVNASS